MPGLGFSRALSLFLWGWTLLIGTGATLAMVLSPLAALGLHFVPLFLLVRVEEPADLCIGGLADIHHLGPAIILRKRAVLMDALHLRVFGIECVLHLGLLIGGEVEFLGQLLGT